jgi:hypothetical protein
MPIGGAVRVLRAKALSKAGDFNKQTMATSLLLPFDVICHVLFAHRKIPIPRRDDNRRAGQVPGAALDLSGGSLQEEF